MPHRRVLGWLVALAGALALAACSGGASTQQNPDNTAVTVAAYTGPAASNADVEAFQVNLWQNINGSNRCGNCHKAGGQSPEFARTDDVNQAYQAALTVVNLTQPSQSLMVQKVAGGHNCWESNAQACADILTTWIQNWAGGGGASGATKIQLQAPPSRTVGATRVFPSDPSLYGSTIYPIVSKFCSRCHSDSAATPQQPYFASSNLAEAYSNAQPKIDLSQATQSRFYERLASESHNCWATTPGGPVDCPGSAAAMLTAIQAFINGIPVTPVDPSLVLSKAVFLSDGTIASGGNRYDGNVIAKWMFKEGTGTVAYDTSGVDPSLDLTLAGDVSWVGGWGIQFGSNTGRAQATTTASAKLYNRITATGQYSVELWVAPANVTQVDAYMASYSGGTSLRNFTVGQHAFQYQAYGRNTSTDTNGSPPLTTSATNQLAQASLQHVVMTYDPTNGRRLYVNGAFTGDVDTISGGPISNWDNTFAFLLGNETSGNRPWQGVVRFAAVHDHALTLAQIQQNYAAGVGELYDLLFDVSALSGVPQSYIMLQASIYDSYSYVLSKPTFINLNPNAQPGSIPIQGMYLGMNGQEVSVGQAYSPLSITVDNADYSPTSGQVLSTMGTVVAQQLGPGSDLFFLSFDRIGSFTHVRTLATPVASAPVDLPASSDIGLHTSAELNASLAAITGISAGNSAVNTTYQSVAQQLPITPSFAGFLSSNQIGMAQIAVQYCDSLVNDPVQAPTFFPGVNFAQTPTSAFGTNGGMDQVITPLINSPAVGINLATQPSDSQVRSELYNLMTLLTNCSTSDPTCTATPARTKTIAIAACAAVLGSSTVLIK